MTPKISFTYRRSHFCHRKYVEGRGHDSAANVVMVTLVNHTHRKVRWSYANQKGEIVRNRYRRCQSRGDGHRNKISSMLACIIEFHELMRSLN